MEFGGAEEPFTPGKQDFRGGRTWKGWRTGAEKTSPSLRWPLLPQHEKGPAPPRPTPPSTRHPRATECHLLWPPLRLTCWAPDPRGKQRWQDPESSPKPDGGKSADLTTSRAPAAHGLVRPRLPVRPEGSARPKHLSSSTRSSAARRRVAQRVLILSRPKVFNRVLRGTLHPPLLVRPACAFDSRLPWGPGPAPSAPGQWGGGGAGQGSGLGGGKS